MPTVSRTARPARAVVTAPSGPIGLVLLILPL